MTYPLQADQAGTVRDDGFFHRSISCRNSSGEYLKIGM